MTASAITSASNRSLARSRGLRRNSPKAGHCGRRIVKISKASSAVAWVLIGRSCGRGTVIEIPSGRVALQTEGLVLGAWRTGGAPAAGLGAQTVSTCGARTPGLRLGGGGPARLARAATIDRGSAVRRPSRPPPLAPFGFNFHGGGDCWRWLARAEQRCRRALSRFDSPRQLAGVGGRRSDCHGQPLFWGRQLQIGDLGHRRQSVTPVFSTLPCSCRGHLSIRTRRRSGVDAQYRRSGTPVFLVTT